MIDTVIFDLAGTTIDCGCMAPVSVFIEVFRRRGIVIDIATARGPMGTHKREHIRQVCMATSEQWASLYGNPPTEQDIDAMYAEAEPLQIAVLPAHATPIPGFQDLLAELRARGLRVGATTGYTAPMVEVLAPLIAKAGWTPDVLVSASDVPAGRPAPYMNQLAMMRLGAKDVRRCLVVGDTVVDMQAARNAGCKAVGVAMTGNEVGLSWEDLQRLSNPGPFRTQASARLLGAGAQVVLDSVLELLPVLEASGS
jgi:phosphonoacetaldehyde hydrolase